MTENKKSSENLIEQLGERKSDFWWNLAYFLILAVAIGFVLVNNDLNKIISPAGIGILLVLGILEVYPTLYLVRLAVHIKENGKNNHQSQGRNS